AEREHGAATEPAHRFVFGFSNGAAFAKAMSLRHADRFGGVIPFSLGWDRGFDPPRWPPGAAPRQYLVAGTLEPPFREETAAWAAKLASLGAPHVHRERVAGHDLNMWQDEFPAAVKWVLRAN